MKRCETRGFVTFTTFTCRGKLVNWLFLRKSKLYVLMTNNKFYKAYGISLHKLLDCVNISKTEGLDIKTMYVTFGYTTSKTLKPYYFAEIMKKDFLTN